MVLKKIRKLFTDNRLRDLLSGNMVISEQIINGFVNMNGVAPEFNRLDIHCGDGVIEAEGEGEIGGVAFNFQGSIELIGLKVNSSQQVVRVMPSGPIKISTPHMKAQITMQCPGLLEELRTLIKYADPETVRGVVIEPDAILLNLHENPVWAEEFKKSMNELPLAKDLKINILDYVEINDIKIEPGAIRVIARRR